MWGLTISDSRVAMHASLAASTDTCRHSLTYTLSRAHAMPAVATLHAATHARTPMHSAHAALADKVAGEVCNDAPRPDFYVSCAAGAACDHAHGHEEFNFAPQAFKSVLCSATWDSDAGCTCSPDGA
jgi:hypothetical protein